MQLRLVKLVLAFSIMLDGVSVKARTAVSITQQYDDYIQNDEGHTLNTFDYDDEKAMNVKKPQEDIMEDYIDITDKYRSDANYKRYRRPHHPRDGILYHTVASTEKWDDDIQVDTHHRIFTKKNKVAKTGSKSDYEKLKFTNKYMESVNDDMDDIMRKVKYQDSQNRKWRNEDTKQVMEGSEEKPQWNNDRSDVQDDYTYYDVKRFNKYKTNFAPINQKSNEKLSRKDYDQSISPTSFAERELQAYLNGHRLRKAVDAWSPTTECNTQESLNTMLLLESAVSSMPNTENSAGTRRASVHHHRYGSGSAQRSLAAGDGVVDVTGGTSRYVTRVNNFTFPHLSVEEAFEEQWNRFITETANEANKTLLSGLICIFLILIILYPLQRYNQCFFILHI